VSSSGILVFRILLALFCIFFWIYCYSIAIFTAASADFVATPDVLAAVAVTLLRLMPFVARSKLTL
jgi:hypothetical protein